MADMECFAGTGFTRLDPEEERSPPHDPTPVRFPTYEHVAGTVWTESRPPPPLQPLFARIAKPSDITSKHVQALNIQIDSPCSPEQLLPPRPDGGSYLDLESSAQTPDAVSYANVTRSDPVIARRRKDFSDRLTELKIDNDTGYRVITKTPRPGTQLPRLAYMRKFWESLENMSQFWDTSLDQYYEAPCPHLESSQSPKRQRLDSATEHDDSSLCAAWDLPSDDRKPKAATDGSADPRTVADEAGQREMPDAGPTITSPEPRPSRRYKGRRTGNGRQMPDSFRVDAVRAFVEGVVWPFQAAVAPPRQMPVVQIDNLNLPVRQTSAVYLVPEDRLKARQGFLQGPMFSLQVRADTDFNADGETDAAARLDLMRELGGLMQIAEERQREGVTEVKPGEGKWWTSKPRWGGGQGGEVENQIGNTDVVQMAEEAVPGTNNRGNSGLMARSKKKKTPAMLWKELKCGTGFWDPRTEYRAVGKDPSSDYDEIFMVSSLNHHISILKLTIHTAYTGYVLTGDSSGKCPADKGWCSPRLQRTEWYNLFDVDQRVQAFQALWGITTYMTRKPETSTHSELTDLSVGRPG